MDPGDDAVAGLVVVPKYVWVKRCLESGGRGSA